MSRNRLPPVYHVVLHMPGPCWDERRSFYDQDGAQEHLAHLARLRRRGVLLFGGPYLDDSGGLVVLQGLSPDQARQLAYSDPAVRMGLLQADVRPWLVTESAGTSLDLLTSAL